MVANATPWGSTISAPVRPAVRSSRVLRRSTRDRQRRKGSARPNRSRVLVRLTHALLVAHGWLPGRQGPDAQPGASA